ncbi:MAG TPA: MazG nucleotide pyrophosphohydrolase domain-containing protein [Gemmatimonadales bacterium]|nr:MazG nucleotide pyrophosphohydrolase domain-containing protein [Gemmatimonadales bacterium]
MQENSALGRVQAIVRDLRVRCPWDRVQTRATLRPYLVEEALELDDALGNGDTDAIRDETGDLMLHLAWQLVLGEERGEFTADEVADRTVHKMQRRHPHLFDLGPKESWETLKRRETPRALLDGLPPTLPSLQSAYRLQQKAASVGFDWPDTAGPAEKVREELAEVEAEIKEMRRGGEEEMRRGEEEMRGGGERGSGVADSGIERDATDPLVEEIGDLLFAVVNLARKARVQPTVALDRANRKFRRRFEQVERLAAERKVDVATAGLAKLDELWDEVKAREASS